MKLKKVLAVSLAAAMTLSMAACGGSSSDSSAASDDATTGSVAATTTESGDAAETTDGALNYASIKIGRGLHRYHDNHPCIQPENRYVRGQLSGKELGSLHC